MASPVTSKHTRDNARPSGQAGNRPEATSSESGERSDELSPRRDLVEYFRQYSREKPEIVALWCLGIGFVLGWKLKPW